MAKVNIKDFFIQLGFDASAVTKGLAKVEKDVKSFSDSFVGLAKKQQTNNSRLLKGINAVNAAKRKQLALDGKLGTQSNTVIVGNLPSGASGSQGGGGGLLGNQAGPDRKTARKLQAQQRTAMRERASLESQAAAENVRRSKTALAMEDKRMVATAALERRIVSINAKYGESEAEIRANAKALKLTARQTEAMVNTVRSIKTEYARLGSEISKTKDARGLKELNEQMKNAISNTKRLTAELDTTNRKLSAGKFAAKGMTDSLKNLSRSYVSVFALGAGATAAGSLGQNLIASKAALLGASGSAEQAASDFEYLQNTSQHLGVSLKESASGYARVGAAARSAGLGVDKARNTFLAAQEVSTAFNLTADDSAGVFRAFSQILSKGKLSTEELLQLGNDTCLLAQ